MWSKIVAFFTAIIAFLASLFGTNIPILSNTKTFKDLSYGSDSQQVMDLYLPKEAKTDAGLFVMIHGGGWVGGDKSSDTETCKSIAENFGYAAMSINYRMFSYPSDYESFEREIADPNSLDAVDMMGDITAALNVAVKKASENGCNIKNACLVGYSAGGHLAMLYAYGYKNSSPVNISFCVSYVGPSDLTDPTLCFNTPEGGLGDTTAQYLVSRLSHTLVTADNFNSAATQAALKAVSPLYYVSDKSVPTILIYGTKDLLVPFPASQRLDAKLTESGVKHEYIVFANSGHGLDNAADTAAHDGEVYNALVNYAKEGFGY